MYSYWTCSLKGPAACGSMRTPTLRNLLSRLLEPLSAEERRGGPRKMRVDCLLLQTLDGFETVACASIALCACGEVDNIAEVFR